MEGHTFTTTDHAEEAARYLRRADEIANRDGHLEFREPLKESFLRFAEIHATLAVAQRLDTIIDLVFDQGRAIRTSTVRDGSA